MDYFYITIIKKENIELLEDTISLIKKYCLKDSNKYSININKQMHSNCILDKNNNFLNVYNSEGNNYSDFATYYQEKYNVSNLDLEILLQAYGYINIEKLEQMKVQIKVYYSFSFISAIQLIIDLLGQNETLSKMTGNPNGVIFNQIINNSQESEIIIIENNRIYVGNYDNGVIKKLNQIKENETLKKYIQYKEFNEKFKQQQKDKKEINKI